MRDDRATNRRSAAKAEGERIAGTSYGPGALSDQEFHWLNRCIDDSIDWVKTHRLEVKRRAFLDGKTLRLFSLSPYSRELGLRARDSIHVVESVVSVERREEIGEKVLVQWRGRTLWIPLNDALPRNPPHEVQEEVRAYWRDLLGHEDQGRPS